MGQSSRDKWMKRAMTYEKTLETQGVKAAQEYIDRFGGKLEKFMKGASDLQDERIAVREDHGH